MNKITLNLFFLLFMGNCFGQTDSVDSLKIAYCRYDSINNVLVYPENVLSDNYDFIIITGFNNIQENKNKRLIKISWTSPNIDGTYCFEITPIQMYIRSYHDNPNPNYLYWIVKSNNKYFELIKKYLEKSQYFKLNNIKKRNYYSYSFVNQYKEEYVNNEWEDNMYKNLRAILSEINKALKATNCKIEIPKEKKLKQNAVLLLFNKSEYYNPTKLKNLENASDSLIIIDN